MSTLSPHVIQAIQRRAAALGTSPDSLIMALLEEPMPHHFIDALPTCCALLHANHPENPIAAVNPAFEACSGYSAAELVGKPWHFLLAGEPMESPPQLEEDTYSGRHAFAARDGRARLHQVHISPLTTDHGPTPYLIAQLIDIAHTQQFAQFIDNTSEGIWAVDFSGSTLYVNRPMARMLGYSVEELLTLSVWDVTSDEIHAEAARNLERQREGKALQHEFRFIHKRGHEVWVVINTTPLIDDAGEVYGMLGFITDISARVAIEKQLAANQARYKLITELITDYIFSVRVEEGGSLLLQWMAGAYERIIGLPPPPPNVPVTFSRIHPEDAPTYHASIERLLENEPVTVTYRVRHAEGHYIWLEVKRTPTWDADAGRVVGFHGAATDISARKQAEEKTQKSVARFRAISEMTSDYAFGFTVNEDGSLTREWITASSLKRITGYTPEESDAAGGWQALTHPEDLPLVRRHLAYLLERGGQLRTLYRIVTKDGEIRHMEGQSRAIRDESGRVVTILGSARDITRERRTQHELAESEARFRTMANSAPVLIWMADATGACSYFNERWLAFRGRTMEQERGHGWLEGMHSADRARYSRLYNAAFNAHEPFSIEYRLLRHDGVYRWIRDDGVPRFLPDGRFAGYIGSCTDITEQRDIYLAMEQLVAERTHDLREANAKLRHLTRLKDEWVSNVSHELRTPLTSLKVRYHLLKSDPSLLADHLPALERETNRLSTTIEDLLKLSRWDQGEVPLERERVDIALLLANLVADRQMAAAERDITLRNVGNGHPQFTRCDPGLISQVMDILITNALKYVTAGGEVIARAHGQAERVGFSISDNGPGIPPDELEHLFDRFFRGTAGRLSGQNGTGLGLSIAKSIVTHHGGTIEVTSQKGGGSTFVVWLPRIEKSRPSG